MIRELLLEYTHVDVSSLCAFLHVSPATVRRDLDALEREGFLLKTYGGAVLNGNGDDDVSLKNVADPFEQERKTIAAFAVNLIEEGDVIFLGAGSICTHMAKLLCMRSHVNVVTCNLNAAQELAGAKNISTAIIGGNLFSSGSNVETGGESARLALSKMYFNRCFLSFDGISLRRGYTADNMDKVGLLHAALANSDIAYALADSGNLDRTSLCAVADLNSIHQVIGPMRMPEPYKEYFLNHDVRLYGVTMD